MAVFVKNLPEYESFYIPGDFLIRQETSFPVISKRSAGCAKVMVKGSGRLYGSAGSHAFSNPEITAQMYAGRKRPGQRIGNVQGKKCVVPAENRKNP